MPGGIVKLRTRLSAISDAAAGEYIGGSGMLNAHLQWQPKLLRESRLQNDTIGERRDFCFALQAGQGRGCPRSLVEGKKDAAETDFT